MSRLRSISILGTSAVLCTLGCSGDVGTQGLTAPAEAVPGQAPVGSPEPTDGTLAPSDPADNSAPIENPLQPNAVCDPVEPLARAVRALSGLQYQNTIRAVFPTAAELPNPHQFSDLSAQFTTNSTLRRFDFSGTQAVIDNARRVAGAVTEGELAATPCLAEAADACVGEWAASLGRELYREPLETSHTDKLVALFQEAARLADAEAGVNSVVRVMLTSPRFLFRKELGTLDAATGQFKLTPHEVASALAYTLTNAPPDELLRASADAGMNAEALLDAHLPRLLNIGEAGRIGMTSFVQELLVVRGFSTIEKDADLFPMFNEEVRSDLIQDFGQTLDATLSSDTPTFAELLLGQNYVVSPSSKELLGWSDMPATAGDAPVAAPEAERLGILTHPVVLGTYAHQDETNPVARGHFLSDTMLCVTIPPPPVAVTFPERTDDGTPKTLRQVLDEQHSVAECAACHSFMDPLGYPFEVFDAVGRLRDSDRGLPLDTSGNIVGTNDIDGPVQDVNELLGRIAGSSRAQACFTQNAFKYIAGVGDANDLSCRVGRLAQAFSAQGGSLPELFGQVLKSPEFLVRVEVDPDL